MDKFSQIIARRLLLAALCCPLAAWTQTSVRSLKVLGGKDAVEIEVEGSDRMVPQTKVLTAPDRLVIDFPNAIPGAQLRNQSVNAGEVKDVRFSLFQSKPPVTRLVIDLKSAQSYQVFPTGRTVLIKVMGGGSDAAAANALPPAHRPALVAANFTPSTEPIHIDEPPARPPLEVSFHDGLLAIRANKATLSEVLFEVQKRTGAQVSIAAGAEQEQVAVDIAAAPAAEVLARLLNGSKFNFLILSASNDPRQLDRVILTPRTEGAVTHTPPPPVQTSAVVDDAEESQPPRPAPSQMQPGMRPTPPGLVVPRPAPETTAPAAPPQDNIPDQ